MFQSLWKKVIATIIALTGFISGSSYLSFGGPVADLTDIKGFQDAAAAIYGEYIQIDAGNVFPPDSQFAGERVQQILGKRVPDEWTIHEYGCSTCDEFGFVIYWTDENGQHARGWGTQSESDNWDLLADGTASSS